MSAPFFLGSLLAVYYFVGRWSLARLEGDVDSVSIIEQPRFWIVALAVAVAVALHASIPKRARQFRPTRVDVAVLAFFAYMLLTCLWAPDAELAHAKATEIALMMLVASVIATTRSCGVADSLTAGFWTAIVAVGSLLAGVTLLTNGDASSLAGGGGPNTFGRNMGLMAFGALYLGTRYGSAARIAGVGLVATAALLIVRCGSRGGLLSFCVAAGTYVVTAKGSLFKKVGIVMVLCAASVGGLFYTAAGRLAMEVFNERIVKLTIENRHFAGREDLWSRAVEMWLERPVFGWGLNGFRVYYDIYPHNIFLEVMVEGGIVGLLLLLNAGRCWLVLGLRNRQFLPRMALVGLVLTLTAAQTSGDLYDSRGVFLMLALATPAVAARCSRPQPSAKKHQLLPRQPSRASGIG